MLLGRVGLTRDVMPITLDIGNICQDLATGMGRGIVIGFLGQS